MSLPKIDTPLFEMNLISIDGPVTYRPFLVKEEKLMLMAIEGGDNTEILKTTKQIINNCVTGIDVENLPIFDLTFALLKIRSKSVGEVIEVVVGHPEQKNRLGDECTGTQKISVDVSKITPTINDTHTKFIRLTDSISVEMKYPTLDLFSKMGLATDTGQVEDLFMMMTDCIDKIYSGDEIFETQDYSKKELNDFVGSLTTEQFEKFKNFFNTMPSLIHEVEYTCPKCGQDEKITLSGLADFFL